MRTKDEQQAEELKTVEAKYEDRIRSLERKLDVSDKTLNNLKTLREKELGLWNAERAALVNEAAVHQEETRRKVSRVLFCVCA